MKFLIPNNIGITSIDTENNSKDCDNLLYSFETGKMIRLSKEYTTHLYDLDFERLPTELIEILIQNGFITCTEEIKLQGDKDALYSLSLFDNTGRCYFGENTIKDSSDIVLDFYVGKDARFDTRNTEVFFRSLLNGKRRLDNKKNKVLILFNLQQNCQLLSLTHLIRFFNENLIVEILSEILDIEIYFLIRDNEWKKWDNEMIIELRRFCTCNKFSPFFLLISSKTERRTRVNESSFLKFLFNNNLLKNYLKAVYVFPLKQKDLYSIGGYEYLTLINRIIVFFKCSEYRPYNLKEYILLSAKQMNLIKK